jgi:hypothetical protein
MHLFTFFSILLSPSPTMLETYPIYTTSPPNHIYTYSVPLTLRSSATWRKQFMASHATVTSPWYMKLSTVSMYLKKTEKREKSVGADYGTEYS